jgi:hypothetical protein
MTRIPGLSMLALALALLAACEGGRGLNFEKVTKLPPPWDYKLGFEPDGTLLYGRSDGLREVLRWDGATWTTHATALWFQVRALSSDRDGAPLLVHRGNLEPMNQVFRIEPDGTAVRLGGLVDDPVHQVMQNVSGSHILFGFPAWLLRPGAAVWEAYPRPLWSPVRTSDGRLYAGSGLGVVRIEDDESYTERVSCEEAVSICTGAPFAVDPAGRIYVAEGSTLHIFDPDLDLVQEASVPDGLSILRLIATESLVVLATRSDRAELAMFALVPGETALSSVHLPPGVPEADPVADPEADNLQLVVDPAGTIYAARDSWLGRLVESR